MQDMKLLDTLVKKIDYLKAKINELGRNSRSKNNRESRRVINDFEKS
jgi:hypothetical protein